MHLSGRVLTISGLGPSERRYSTSTEILADDPSVLPLSLADDLASRIADRLETTADSGPLVIGTAAEHGHRCSVAYWIGGGVQQPISDYGTLEGLVREWDGVPVDPDRRYRVLESARRVASEHVTAAAERALAVRRAAARRRRAAAARRLRNELGRYLVARGEDVHQLNDAFYQVMLGGGDEADRARRAFALLGEYPEWSRSLREELERFDSELTPARRASRISGMEIEAAIADPRWRQVVP